MVIDQAGSILSTSSAALPGHQLRMAEVVLEQMVFT